MITLIKLIYPFETEIKTAKKYRNVISKNNIIFDICINWFPGGKLCPGLPYFEKKL